MTWHEALTRFRETQARNHARWEAWPWGKNWPGWRPLIWTYFLMVVGSEFLPLEPSAKTLPVSVGVGLMIGIVAWYWNRRAPVPTEAPVATEVAAPIEVAGASGEKPCPYCAETIRAAAIVCRFCNRSLVPEEGGAFGFLDVAGLVVGAVGLVWAFGPVPALIIVLVMLFGWRTMGGKTP